MVLNHILLSVLGRIVEGFTTNQTWSHCILIHHLYLNSSLTFIYFFSPFLVPPPSYANLCVVCSHLTFQLCVYIPKMSVVLRTSYKTTIQFTLSVLSRWLCESSLFKRKGKKKKTPRTQGDLFSTQKNLMLSIEVKIKSKQRCSTCVRVIILPCQTFAMFWLLFKKIHFIWCHKPQHGPCEFLHSVKIVQLCHFNYVALVFRVSFLFLRFHLQFCKFFE